MTEAFGLSDVGCVRTNNEDCYRLEPELGLYVLADGMGGAKAGECASRMAVDAVAEVQMEAQSARAISGNAAALDTFELRFQASLLAGGVLSGSLSTSSLGQSGSNPACVVNEQFSARWMGP